MFEKRTARTAFRVGVIVLTTLMLCLLVRVGDDPLPALRQVAARRSPATRGTYGGDMEFLRRFHTPPRQPGESNHYIDLWSPGALPILAQVQGLTNNHALIVDSHGKAGCSALGLGYGFYPRRTLLGPEMKVPYYSAADFAALLGPEQSAQIHNILLAGCNEEGRLRSRDLRRHFVNATNITYMTPGKVAFKPMFYQALVLPESDIMPLYGRLQRSPDGQLECEILSKTERGAQRLGAYIADLYLPGARSPFRTRQAARDLLAPPTGKPGA